MRFSLGGASQMEELGPLFIAPHEPDRLGPLIAIVAGFVILVALAALVRGRLPDLFSFSALLLVPLFVYAVGDLHLLEVSKRVEFCGSCHETMSPIVDAMRSDTESLASSHYRRGAVPHDTACYRCHSGYGMSGDTKAKLAGVMHMAHTVTGNYEYPLTKVGAFDIQSCLDCHAQAAPFREQEAHRDPDIQKSLLSGEIGCTGACHVVPHPPEALEGAAAWAASR
jgi:nitrate/TMAO reductase-like tetraheme cytochrome c subunit